MERDGWLRPSSTRVGPGAPILLRAGAVVQKSTDTDWIIKAMIAVAASDGRLNAREVGLIQKLVKARTGRSVDASGIVLAVQAYATKRDIVAELTAEAGSMSEETKEEIIRAAYLMLRADGYIAKEELKKLKEIAAALRISEHHLGAIMAATKPPSD
jgi:tellurite resistance protein